MLLLQKYGHYKFECSKLKSKEEGSSSSVAGVVEGNSESSEFVLAVTGSDGRFKDQWVLDTACTFHMSHKRDRFNTYELVNGGSVLMKTMLPARLLVWVQSG